MVKSRTQLYNDLAVFLGGVQLYVRDLQNVSTLTGHSFTSPWKNNMFVKTSLRILVQFERHLQILFFLLPQQTVVKMVPSQYQDFQELVY